MGIPSTPNQKPKVLPRATPWPDRTKAPPRNERPEYPQSRIGPNGPAERSRVCGGPRPTAPEPPCGPEWGPGPPTPGGLAAGPHAVAPGRATATRRVAAVPWSGRASALRGFPKLAAAQHRPAPGGVP